MALSMQALGALTNNFSDGMARLARIRTIPGYNEAVLRKYGSALPLTVFNAELLRLQRMRGKSLAPDPVASAFNALANAYRSGDQFDIQRWERAVTKIGARRYLDRVRLAARKDRRLGYTTAGFWQRHPGMSGLG